MSNNDLLPPLPAPPDPTTVEQIVGQVRTVIALASGIGLGGAWLSQITDKQLSGEVTAVLTVVSLAVYAGTAVNSWISKRRKAEQERRITVASAAASAALGQPVAVTVTPGAAPNILTKISNTEIAAAPTAPLNVEPNPAPKVP